MNGSVLKNLKLLLTMGVGCSILSGCVFPLKSNQEDKTIHVNYEKIQNAILCHVIDAWKIEYDYHDRPIATNGTNWYTTIQLIHTRTGSFGSANTASTTDTPGNWTNVISTRINPSLSNTYELTANTKSQIPASTFTKESIQANPQTSEGLQFTPKQEAICADNKYVNLGELGIVKQFENYIKGFEPEDDKKRRGRRYTDLEFDETARLVASIDGSFTFALVPQTAIFPPSLGYTDQIAIEVDVNRRELYPPEEEEETSEVTVANSLLNVSGNINIVNAQELACRINFPFNSKNGADRAKFRECIGNTRVGITPTRQTSRTTPAPSIPRQPSLLQSTDPFVADTSREPRRRALEEAVEDIGE